MGNVKKHTLSRDLDQKDFIRLFEFDLKNKKSNRVQFI